MGKVRNILQTKSNTIFSVTPDTIVYNALEVMFEKNVSALLVMENENPVGIFTERDYARNIALKGKSSRETKISDIMTKNLITITSDYTIDEAMRLMTEKFIRHLPVMDENKLVGIISIGDLVKHLIEEQKFIIGSLENYISHT
ncbi:MAG TPA: CBS domain-containing protein [Chitinophagaceae bacterium]|nr:CBS domain-containing protein [Chitinophagaceae bacterium]